MKVRFKILGYEVATLSLELDDPGTPDLPVAAAEKVIKWASKRWSTVMFR